MKSQEYPEVTFTNYWPVEETTLVTINRNHAQGYDPSSPKGYDHGPLSINEALKKGLLSTSSGTMTYSIKIAEGDFDGAMCQQREGQWYAITFDKFCNGKKFSR